MGGHYLAGPNNGRKVSTGQVRADQIRASYKV